MIETYNCMKSHKKYIVLLMDEIHIQPYLDYKGGNIGITCNKESLVTSAYVFMIK